MAQSYIEIGDQLSQIGEYQNANLEYRKARLLSPRNAEILLKIGQTYYKLADFENAINFLEKAVKLAPKNAKIYLSLTEILVETDDIDSAISYLKKGLSQIPENNELKITLARLYLIKNEPDQAIQTSQKADSPYWLGLSYAVSGDYQKAKETLGESWEEKTKVMSQALDKILQTSHPASQKVILAQALNQNGEPEISLPILKEVTYNWPDYRDGWVMLGTIYLAIDNLEQAEKSLMVAQDIDPVYPKTFELLGQLWQEKGDPIKAAEFYNKAKILSGSK